MNANFFIDSEKPVTVGLNVGARPRRISDFTTQRLALIATGRSLQEEEEVLGEKRRRSCYNLLG